LPVVVVCLRAVVLASLARWQVYTPALPYFYLFRLRQWRVWGSAFLCSVAFTCLRPVRACAVGSLLTLVSRCLISRACAYHARPRLACCGLLSAASGEKLLPRA